MLQPNIQLFADGGEGGQGNAASNQNGGNNAQEGGNTPKTYTQEELDRIVSERTGRATKSALKSFFTQKGLSEEEANTAIGAYLENKKKNTPDLAALQQSLSDKLSEAIKKVPERVPAFKKQTETAGGVHRVGGDGNSEGQPQSTVTKAVPQKKWNRFNL